jgi:hypothetical protein
MAKSVVAALSGSYTSDIACMSDAQTLCAAVIDNLQARRACMTEHSAELSAGCKAAIANGAAERQASLIQPRQ